MNLSKQEQDYLKAIYQLSQDMTQVSVNAISNKLGVSAPSTTGMIKRLQAKQLVAHKPYQGVELSVLGVREARFIIKAHRVWETFLVAQLGYLFSEVHREAEHLEHASSARLIEALYEFLGRPKKDPHGSEIPSEFFEGNRFIPRLSDARTGRYLVCDYNQQVASYLTQMNCGPLKGETLTLIDRLGDDSVIIEVLGKRLTFPYYLQNMIEVDDAGR